MVSAREPSQRLTKSRSGGRITTERYHSKERDGSRGFVGTYNISNALPPAQSTPRTLGNHSLVRAFPQADQRWAYAGHTSPNVAPQTICTFVERVKG